MAKRIADDHAGLRYHRYLTFRSAARLLPGRAGHYGKTGVDLEARHTHIPVRET